MSSFIQVLQSVLEWLNGFIGDYGWSVFVFTVVFRFCLMPFDIISRRSLKKQSLDMARIQPKLDALKTKYANDQEKLNKKTMELYKKENVSMFGGCAGGCLPMLIQWPLFIAFYSAIRGVSELQIFHIYQTMAETGSAVIPRWLWVQDVWQPDTFNATVIPAYSAIAKQASFAEVTEEAYNTVMAPLMTQYDGIVNGLYILPVLAAGASFLQGWLASYLQKTPEQRAAAKKPKKQGEPQDPNESTGKMMQYMFPIMSFFFCMSSSAAFALYWLASNIASICSTLLIDRVILRKLNQQQAAQQQPKEEIF